MSAEKRPSLTLRDPPTTAEDFARELAQWTWQHQSCFASNPYAANSARRHIAQCRAAILALGGDVPSFPLSQGPLLEGPFEGDHLLAFLSPPKATPSS